MLWRCAVYVYVYCVCIIHDNTLDEMKRDKIVHFDIYSKCFLAMKTMDASDYPRVHLSMSLVSRVHHIIYV